MTVGPPTLTMVNLLDQNLSLRKWAPNEGSFGYIPADSRFSWNWGPTSPIWKIGKHTITIQYDAIQEPQTYTFYLDAAHGVPAGADVVIDVNQYELTVSVDDTTVQTYRRPEQLVEAH